jgi:hypothetical protein
MNDSQRIALLILLDREMLLSGSWCGETHLQKATFLLQDMTGVDLGFDFVLYRHGPFSFELRDQLSTTVASELLTLQVKQLGYGPAYVPTTFSETFLQRFPKTTARYIEQIKFISAELGDMNVGALEKLATAFFITEHGTGEGLRTRADQLVEIKPHISRHDAIKACEDVDHMIERAADFRVEGGSSTFSE